MHLDHPEGVSSGNRAIDRRGFLKLSGAGLMGAALAGAFGTDAQAQTPAIPALVREFEDAAEEFDVPAAVLMAMGYVNTRWEMPPPEANEYAPGSPGGWGSYGLMALARNPRSDTLGEASRLTGIPEEELATDRRSNIRGGAALLAEALGTEQPATLEGFGGALFGKGAAPGRNFEGVAGIGSGGLYVEQVFETMTSGAAEMIDGERISLSARDLIAGQRGI